MSSYTDLLQHLTSELAENWYAAEDMSESQLLEAYEAISEQNFTQETRRKFFEGTIEMVVDELLCGEVGAEILQKILEYRNTRGHGV